MNQLYGNTRYKKKKQVKRIKLYAWLGVGALVIIVLAYSIGFTGLFKIQRISVVGADDIDPTALIEKLKPQVATSFWGRLFGTENYLSWDPTIAYSNIEYASTSITKDFLSRTVTIQVVPREQYAVWCIAPMITGEEPTFLEQCYWIDDQGIAFEPSAIPDGQIITKITEHATSSQFIIGDTVLDSFAFMNAKKILDTIKSMQLAIKEIRIIRKNFRVEVEVSNGTNIYFSLRFDPTISALPALKKLRVSPGLAGFEYVDLTVENRALVKPR